MPKIFSASEKNKIRADMFEAGLELLKEHGMTHMSVDKITSAAGIGKSTFYNFFMSKEEFVFELIEYQREKFWSAIKDILGDREKMTRAEGENMLKQIIRNTDSVYQYLTPEDEAKISSALPEETKADISEETEIMKKLFAHIENVREDIDYAVVSNLLKILALAAENKKMLHESGYVCTQEKIFRLLFECIFEEDENGK